MGRHAFRPPEVKTLSQRFENEFSEIAAVYNFESGSEFELALCYLLRQVLPKHYGVCRGHVVTRGGETAGDDIIIYDTLHFPTLTHRRWDEFGRKEHVPIEAVLAYIEAKHTISVVGAADDTGTLAKAVTQVDKVKRLVMSREPLSPADKIRGIHLGPLVAVSNKPDFPAICNPVFVSIVSRYVKPSKKTGDTTTITDALKIHGEAKLSDVQQKPDLIVLGADDLFVAAASGSPGEPSRLDSPFFVEGKSELSFAHVDGVAFGVFTLRLMQAIDWIRLQEMRFSVLISEALGGTIK